MRIQIILILGIANFTVFYYPLIQDPEAFLRMQEKSIKEPKTPVWHNYYAEGKKG